MHCVIKRKNEEAFLIMFGLMIGSWKPGIGDPSFMGWFAVYQPFFHMSSSS